MSSLPLESWFQRGFAGFLPSSSLLKFWDKMVGGSLAVLAFVAVALIESSRVSLMACSSSDEVIKCLSSISDESAEVIAQKGIDLWLKNGGQLLPSGCSSHDKNQTGQVQSKNSEMKRPSSWARLDGLDLAPRIVIDDE